MDEVDERFRHEFLGAIAKELRAGGVRLQKGPVRVGNGHHVRRGLEKIVELLSLGLRLFEFGDVACGGKDTADIAELVVVDRRIVEHRGLVPVTVADFQGVIPHQPFLEDALVPLPGFFRLGKITGEIGTDQIPAPVSGHLFGGRIHIGYLPPGVDGDQGIQARLDQGAVVGVHILQLRRALRNPQLQIFLGPAQLVQHLLLLGDIGHGTVKAHRRTRCIQFKAPQCHEGAHGAVGQNHAELRAVIRSLIRRLADRRLRLRQVVGMDPVSPVPVGRSETARLIAQHAEVLVVPDYAAAGDIPVPGRQVGRVKCQQQTFFSGAGRDLRPLRPSDIKVDAGPMDDLSAFVSYRDTAGQDRMPLPVHSPNAKLDVPDTFVLYALLPGGKDALRIIRMQYLAPAEAGALLIGQTYESQE